MFLSDIACSACTTASQTCARFSCLRREIDVVVAELHVCAELFVLGCRHLQFLGISELLSKSAIQCSSSRSKLNRISFTEEVDPWGCHGIPMGGILEPQGSMGSPGVGSLGSWASGTGFPSGIPGGCSSAKHRLQMPPRQLLKLR